MASDDRAKDRHRRIALATVVGAASRALSALALVIAVPLVSSHLGSASTGVWSLLVTAVALLGFADLGLSNGLLNVLAGALGEDDRDVARRAITATVAGLAMVALIGAAVALIAVPLVPWADLLHVEPGQVPHLDRAIGVFAGIVLLTIPAGIGQRIHLAYQQGWAAALTSGIGSILSLAAVLVAATADAGLEWFVAAMLGGVTVAYLAETIWVLGRSHCDLRPRRADFDWGNLRRLLRSGFLFFVLAAAGAAAYQTDTVVISNHLGAAEVTGYVVSLRLFTLAPSALATLFLPLWPAYGEAIARRDHQWVATTLRRSLLLGLGVSAISSLVLIVVARPLLEAWTPSTPSPSTSLLLGLGAWAVVSAFSTALAMYLNGANIIRFQVIASSTMAVSNVALSIVFVRGFGISGPVWASVLTQTIVILVPAIVMLRPVLRNARSEPQADRPSSVIDQFDRPRSTALT